MSSTITQKNHFVVLAILTLGSFCIGMAEFFTIWLSPTIAQELKTTTSNVTSATSYYAFGVMLGIPLLSPFIKYLSHQKMLAVLLFWCFLGNMATSFVTTWEQLRWVRILAGMPHGMFFGIASMVLIQMFPKSRHGLGIGILMSGIGFALILVVPASIHLGAFQDWRIITRVLGLVDLLIILLLHDLLNDAPPPPDSQSQWSATQILKNPLLWWAALLGITAFAGRMPLIAYAEAILIQTTQLPKSHLPFTIIATGIGTCIGFLFGGYLADKSIYKTLLGSMIYGFFLIAAFNFLAPYPAGFYLGFVLIGSYTLFLPASQLLIIACSPQAPTFAACLNHGTLNIGNAIGPILGAYLMASGFGIMSITWVGMILSPLSILILICGYPKARALVKTARRQ